jgi:ADP-heptose:LPS heptosyltransferase
MHDLASNRLIGSPLVVRFGRLGDTVLLQPLLHALHRRYDAPCILLARGSWPQALYAGHPDVATVISLQDAHRPLLLDPQRWRIILQLRRSTPRPVYVCEPEPRALRKIKNMLTLAGIEQDSCVFISDIGISADEHWVDRLIRFASSTPPAYTTAPAGVEHAEAFHAPVLKIDDSDRSACDAWLRELGPHDAAPVLLQPANKRTIRWNGARGPDDDKWWPEQRWVELALAIRRERPDSKVLLCGAPPEADYLSSMSNAARDPAVHAVANDLPLRRLMALTERAHSMVSVDTGPAHIAAAFGCPLVVLFGRVSPTQWLPRNANGSTVLALGGPPRGGRVDALSVEEVFAAWNGLETRRPEGELVTRETKIAGMDA